MRPSLVPLPTLMLSIATGFALLSRSYNSKAELAQDQHQDGDDSSLLYHQAEFGEIPKNDAEYYGHDSRSNEIESSSPSWTATNQMASPSSPSIHNSNNNDDFNTNHNFINTRLPDKEYLTHGIADEACRLNRGFDRKDRLNNTYLSYCTRYKLEDLLSNEVLMSMMHNSSATCDRIIDEFIQLDELINQFDRLFKNLLTRYNCHNGYSVKWSCDDCKVSGQISTIRDILLFFSSFARLCFVDFWVSPVIGYQVAWYLY